MSELWRDALFASDGTAPSAPVRDRSGEGSADPPVFPSVQLPPLPPLGMTRDEVAAALRDGSGGLAGPDPVAAPTPPPPAPTPHASEPSSPPAAATAPQPAPPAARAARPAPANRPARPVISPAPQPDQGPPRRLGALRYARRVVPTSRLRVQRRDPIPRTGGHSRGGHASVLSDGGAGVFFTIMFITFVILLYFIFSGLLAAFARLIP